MLSILYQENLVTYLPLYFVPAKKNPLNLQEINFLILLNQIFLNVVLAILLSVGLLNVLLNKSQD